MSTIFLSYSTKDHYFAELAAIKLKEADIELWRDQGKLRAGMLWHQEIETSIASSLAVLVALSAESAASSYVTFEWAYALGKGKVIIPVRLGECKVHPRLEGIQYLDFSIAGSLPWESLVERIREIEPDTEQAQTITSATPDPGEHHARAILAYLNQRGYQMASFDRLRRRIDNLTDEEFQKIIDRNSAIFRPARLRDGRPGIAKLIP